jgi:hypothetical protein
MTTEASKASEASLMRYWPFAVAGLVGPVAATELARWMPLHFAFGGTFFVAFTAAHWSFQRTSVRPDRRSLRASIVSGLAGGLVAGLIAFLLPWR